MYRGKNRIRYYRYTIILMVSGVDTVNTCQ